MDFQAAPSIAKLNSSAFLSNSSVNVIFPTFSSESFLNRCQFAFLIFQLGSTFVALGEHLFSISKVMGL